MGDLRQNWWVNMEISGNGVKQGKKKKGELTNKLRGQKAEIFHSDFCCMWKEWEWKNPQTHEPSPKWFLPLTNTNSPSGQLQQSVPPERGPLCTLP